MSRAMFALWQVCGRAEKVSVKRSLTGPPTMLLSFSKYNFSQEAAGVVVLFSAVPEGGFLRLLPLMSNSVIMWITLHKHVRVMGLDNRKIINLCRKDVVNRYDNGCRCPPGWLVCFSAKNVTLIVTEASQYCGAQQHC